MGFLEWIGWKSKSSIDETTGESASSSKSWQEAGDVLIEMSTFQHQLGELFDQYRERTNSPRLEMLLDLLSERAYKCEKDLAAYVKDTMPRKLKQTRIQFRVSHTPRSLLGELCDVENPTSDDITDVGLKADQYFENVFHELIAVADRDAQLTARCAAEAGARSYEDYRSAIVEPCAAGATVLFVALPVFEADEYLQLAANHGLHVFALPPVARTSCQRNPRVRSKRALGRLLQRGGWCHPQVSKWTNGYYRQRRGQRCWHHTTDQRAQRLHGQKRCCRQLQYVE